MVAFGNSSFANETRKKLSRSTISHPSFSSGSRFAIRLFVIRCCCWCISEAKGYREAKGLWLVKSFIRKITLDRPQQQDKVQWYCCFCCYNCRCCYYCTAGIVIVIWTVSKTVLGIQQNMRVLCTVSCPVLLPPSHNVQYFYIPWNKCPQHSHRQTYGDTSSTCPSGHLDYA